MNSRLTRYALIAALIGASALMAGCPKVTDSTSTGGATTAQVNQLQLILYAHGNAASVARRVTEARETLAYHPPGIEAQPEAAPNATTVNAAGVAVGVTFNPDPLNTAVLTVHTDAGYTFCLDTVTGDVCLLPVIYFESQDCSGPPLVTKGSPPSNSTTALAGSVGFQSADGTAWALPASTPVQNDTAQSQFFSGSCLPIGLQGAVFYQAVQNDSLTTLIPGANLGTAFSFGAPQ